MIKRNTLFIFPLLTFILFGSLNYHGYAQDIEADEPVYIVQEGDSLWDIARRFGISLDSLVKANGITDQNQLNVGDQLTIPGLVGIQGVLTTKDIPFGHTLNSLSKLYQIPVETLIKLNHISSDSELYVGRSFVLLEQDEKPEMVSRMSVPAGSSLFEMGVVDQTNPWKIILDNELSGSWDAIPGQVLINRTDAVDSAVTQQSNTDQPGVYPDDIDSISIKPLPLIQGRTTAIHVKGENINTINGSLMDHKLNFFSEKAGDFYSLQGIHAMSDPGVYDLTINIELSPEDPNYGTTFTFTQPIYVRNGNYAFDPGLTVSPETIDPAVTKPEDAQWSAIASSVSGEKLWDGIFQSPTTPEFSNCWPSLFGNRRSYNGSAYDYFHTGLDFCGGVGTEIYAPAAGKVLFAGPLTVRGNATVIDHGWGVLSAYMHQSETFVKSGDVVKPGQIIGLVGGTGRVTGPHLHWEIWTGGVQVDPLDWLEQAFP